MNLSMIALSDGCTTHADNWGTAVVVSNRLPYFPADKNPDIPTSQRPGGQGFKFEK